MISEFKILLKYTYNSSLKNQNLRQLGFRLFANKRDFSFDVPVPVHLVCYYNIITVSSEELSYIEDISYYKHLL